MGHSGVRAIGGIAFWHGAAPLPSLPGEGSDQVEARRLKHLASPAGRGRNPRHDSISRGRQIALAAMFTVRASNVALKMNDAAPWAATRRRSGRDVTATSDTCDVMPTTKEKYIKSQ